MSAQDGNVAAIWDMLNGSVLAELEELTFNASSYTPLFLAFLNDHYQVRPFNYITGIDYMEPSSLTKGRKGEEVERELLWERKQQTTFPFHPGPPVSLHVYILMYILYVYVFVIQSR